MSSKPWKPYHRFWLSLFYFVCDPIQTPLFSLSTPGTYLLLGFLQLYQVSIFSDQEKKI